jgi:hypothetical protein
MKADQVKLKPKHKWFCAADSECEMWHGPYKSIEAAAIEVLGWPECPRVWIAQGRKVTRAERDEWGNEHEWEVTSSEAFELRSAEREKERA